jgi:hypothetical protein
VIVAEVAVLTGEVVMTKVAVVAPATTVTVAGTDADVLLLDRFTVNPPVGAVALSVTVPVTVAEPPVTVPGLTDTLLGPITFTTTEAVFDPPLSVAVIVTVAAVDWTPAVVVNVAVV